MIQKIAWIVHHLFLLFPDLRQQCLGHFSDFPLILVLALFPLILDLFVFDVALLHVFVEVCFVCGVFLRGLWPALFELSVGMGSISNPRGLLFVCVFDRGDRLPLRQIFAFGVYFWSTSDLFHFLLCSLLL